MALVGPAAAAGAAARGVQEPGKGYVVVFRHSVASVGRETDDLERAKGFKARFRYRAALKGFSARLTPRQVAELRADPSVAAVSEDLPVHALASTVPLAAGETVPTGVARIQAGTASSVRPPSSVGVAVIDTGINLGHPDLAANAASGTNCVSPGASAQDDNGHGTHVAGTIAAQNNGAGVVGVTPGTKLYAVKVLDASGSGTWSGVICGIDWVKTNAAALNIGVANMSLGGSGSSADNNACAGVPSALHLAICNATAPRSAGGGGVIFAVAAGNSGWAFPDPSFPDVPAAYPEVLTVAAMSDSDGRAGAAGGAPTCRTGERDDYFASFSNFSNNSGDNAHTLAAPGVCILSTWLGSGYNTISGTSMATPHVTGTVALCLGENPPGGSPVPGPCSGAATNSPSAIIPNVTSTDPLYGFIGDPNHPAGGFYGYLAYAGATATPAPPPAAAPAVTTGSATNVTRSSATLNGSVNPNGQATTYYFEWGTTSAYGNRTPVAGAGSGKSAVAVSAAIAGLNARRTYHYRLVAASSAGTSRGADRAFTTRR